jgi:hypothetical protein
VKNLRRGESWNLWGHQRIAGRISEQVIGGGNLLRVDVPDGEDQFRTVFYGSSAIYAMHVTDEAAARAACKGMGTRPAYAWELERLQKLPAATVHSSSSYDDREDDDIPI